MTTIPTMTITTTAAMTVTSTPLSLGAEVVSVLIHTSPSALSQAVRRNISRQNWSNSRYVHNEEYADISLHSSASDSQSIVPATLTFHLTDKGQCGHLTAIIMHPPSIRSILHTVVRLSVVIGRDRRPVEEEGVRSRTIHPPSKDISPEPPIATRTAQILEAISSEQV